MAIIEDGKKVTGIAPSKLAIRRRPRVALVLATLFANESITKLNSILSPIISSPYIGRPPYD